MGTKSNKKSLKKVTVATFSSVVVSTDLLTKETIVAFFVFSIVVLDEAFLKLDFCKIHVP